MKIINRDIVNQVDGALYSSLGVLSLLEEDNCIIEQDVFINEVLFKNNLLRIKKSLHKSYLLLERELIRTSDVWDEKLKIHVKNKRKLSFIKIKKACKAVELTLYLWQTAIFHKCIEENIEISLQYFPKTGFKIISDRLIIARDLLESVL